MLIILEGIDGSGKSTLAKSLVSSLAFSEGRSCLIKYPINPFYRNLIYNSLHTPHLPPEDLFPLSLLFSVDRYSYEKELSRTLRVYDYVVTERYTPSNLAYSSAHLKEREERTKFIERLYSFEHELLRITQPDLVLLVDVGLEKIKDLPTGNRLKDVNERNYQIEVMKSYKLIKEMRLYNIQTIPYIKNNKQEMLKKALDKIL